MHRIREADKIAAGEVVERPASVVKELVENALDAGATTITVNVENYGKDLVEVVDDGCGIHPDDVALAFEKHTSSKIRAFEDLARLVTLGFRGEALASICLVARVEIVTRVATETAATVVTLEDGHVTSRGATAREPGTTIRVRTLFYNVPARRKFLKSDHVELGHVSDVVSRYSLAYPGVHFRYYHDGALLLNSPGTDDLLQAIAHCYSVKFAKAMVPAHYVDETRGVAVHGFVSRPSLTRSSKSESSFFVNRRFIRSKELVNAVLRAYKNRVMKRRFPVVVLFLELDPAQIDVNIHPTKKHVRFSHPQLVFNCVLLAVSRALRKVTAIPGEALPGRGPRIVRRGEGPGELGGKGGEGREEREETDSGEGGEGREGGEREEGAAHQPGEDLDAGAGKLAGEGRAGARGVDPAADGGAAVQLRLPGLVGLSGGGAGTGAGGEGAAGGAGDAGGAVAERLRRQFVTTPGLPALRPLNELGQLADTYLFMEGAEGDVYVIDQHAAAERIRYEEIEAQLATKGLDAQRLLSPVKLEVSAHEAEFLKAHLAEFARYGFVIEFFGGRTFLARQFPVVLGHVMGSEEARATIVDLVKLSHSTSFEAARDAIVKYMACHTSTRAGEALGLPQIVALVRRLGQCADPFHCCHGRPTIIKITRQELEKRFKRVA